MFFKETKLKRTALRLLTMHQAVTGEMKKQIEAILTSDMLSLRQESEIIIFVSFTSLKSIKAAIPEHEECMTMSKLFFDFLLDNQSGYGIEGGLKECVLELITEGRLEDYDNFSSIEEVPQIFIEKIGLQDKDISEVVDSNFYIAFMEGKKIIQN